MKCILPQIRLESSHDQMNRKTPRHNNFWSALYRITNFLIKQVFSYKQKIFNNYNYAIRKTLKDGQRIKDEEMIKQQKFFNTRYNYCNCSENKLISSQLGIDMPCIFRLKLANPPQIEKIMDFNLTLKNQWEKLEL